MFRKVAGLNNDDDATPAAKIKRELPDSDGGEELGFGKKPRLDTVSANDLK